MKQGDAEEQIFEWEVTITFRELRPEES